jgi:hypothetical protein
MSAVQDPVDALIQEALDASGASSSAITARFHGFDVDDGPLIVDVPGLPGEIVRARTTVPLRRAHIAASVVVLFEDGNRRRPIIIGVVQQARVGESQSSTAAPTLSVQADGERLVIAAEQEIVLRCGAASVTLTRAGKVLIKGAYVLSSSTGYNKIKGAAVDIN